MTQDRRHPPSSYDPKYPYNRVTVTESGHEFHWDDTQGKERIRLAHRSGSYTEWSPDGRRVDMIVGNHVQYVKGGVTMTSDKNIDLKTAGSIRTNADGHSHEEIRGSKTSAVESDVRSIVGGHQVSAVGGDFVQGVSGKYVAKIGGPAQWKVDGDMATKVSGRTSFETGSGMLLDAGSSVTVKSGSSTTVSAGSSVTITAGSSGSLS